MQKIIDIAFALGVKAESLRELIRGGKIHAKKKAKVYYALRSHVEKYLEAHSDEI